MNQKITDKIILTYYPNRRNLFLLPLFVLAGVLSIWRAIDLFLQGSIPSIITSILVIGVVFVLCCFAQSFFIALLSNVCFVRKMVYMFSSMDIRCQSIFLFLESTSSMKLQIFRVIFTMFFLKHVCPQSKQEKWPIKAAC